MSVKVFKGGKPELIEPDLLHQYLQNGYTLDNKPPKQEKPKKAAEEK